MTGAMRREGWMKRCCALNNLPALSKAWAESGYELRAAPGSTFYVVATYPDWIFIVRHYQGGGLPPSPSDRCKVMVKDRESGVLLADVKQALNIGMLDQVIRDWRRSLHRERGTAVLGRRTPYMVRS